MLSRGMIFLFAVLFTAPIVNAQSDMLTAKAHQEILHLIRMEDIK